MKHIILFLLLASSVFAQTANVIELTPADQARAQKAWDGLQKAQAEWDGLRSKIIGDYLTDPKSVVCQGAACGGRIISEFNNGFEFSTDFRFIVPKQPEPQKPTFYPSVIPAYGAGWPDCSKGPC